MGYDGRAEVIDTTNDISVIVGFVDYDFLEQKANSAIYNAAAVIQDKNLKKIIHKTLLPSYDVFDEDRYFSPTRNHEIIELNIKKSIYKIGLEICEDMWDEDYPTKVTKILAHKGAQFIINISAHLLTLSLFLAFFCSCE